MHNTGTLKNTEDKEEDKETTESRAAANMMRAAAATVLSTRWHFCTKRGAKNDAEDGKDVFGKSLVKHPACRCSPCGGDVRLTSSLAPIGSPELLLAASPGCKNSDWSGLNRIEGRFVKSPSQSSGFRECSVCHVRLQHG